MIVTCTKCQAKFRVADEKIGPRGAKVRCSKCQTVFLVRPEGAAAVEASPATPTRSGDVEPQRFEQCKLDFSERTSHAGVYAMHRDLLRLRREDPVFHEQRRGKVDGAVLGVPVLSKDILYVGTYGGTVYGLNTASGQNVWSKQASSWIWNGPSLNGTDLFVGDANGKLFSFPVSGNGQPWTQALSGAIIGTPLVTADSVIVGTEAGSVYFVDRAGKNAKPIAVSGKLYATPITAGDLTLVAPTDGSASLVALDKTGAIKWSFIPPK